MTHTVNREPCPTLLRILIDYDPSSGEMTWRRRPAWTSKATKNNHHPETVTDRFNHRYAGTSALSSKKGNGYLYGTIKGKNLLAHRVAWCIFYGYWPKLVIDHINGDRSDNRVENMRDVSILVNGRNRFSKPVNGRSGITFDKKSKKWVARIQCGGKNLYLGASTEKNIASELREKAEERIWGNER